MKIVITEDQYKKLRNQKSIDEIINDYEYGE